MKYLIKCKSNGQFAIYNSNCVKSSSDNTVILSRWAQTDERSEFYIEHVSDNDFYIKSATAENIYVYAINKEQEASNVGIKAFDAPDETCLWTISYNVGTAGFYIKPKGGSNAWNCYGSYDGNDHMSQWGDTDDSNSTWYLIPTELPSGYYTLKNRATDRNTNYFNDFTYDQNPNGYTMGASTLPETLTNGYIWHVTNNKGVLTLTNGQGGDAIKADDGTTTSTLNVMAYTDGGYAFYPVLNAGNSARQIGDYQKLTTWPAGGTTHADNLWNFNNIENFDESNIYNVVVNNAAGYVKLTATNEAAKNNGFFYLSTTPQVSDFTAAEVENMKSAITIEGNIITATYSLNSDGLKAKAATTETEVLAKTGVGYPAPSSEEYAALSQAIANAKAATDENVDELNAALDAAILAYKTTENVQMPEDGKAYRMAYIYNDGAKQYLYWNGSRIAANQDDQISDKNTSIFICHKVDDKYLFATNQGTYLSWMDNGSADKSYNTKGVTDSYIAQNAWTVEPADANANGGTVSATRVDLFGRMQMKALDKNGTVSYYLNVRHEKGSTTTDADFISGWAGSKYYDSGWDGRPRSHTFVFEEVTYPNLITFSSTEGAVSGADYVATFSAPFATLLPEGVKAYYGKKSDDGTKVVLTEVEGEAVPANQGVILTSTSDVKVYMAPAAGETPATIESNALGNSAGAEKALEAGKAYILGKGTKGVAFYKSAAGTLPMNRAYLKNESDASVSSILMVFGETVDGIEDAAVTEGKDIPIYDLTGRRVLKAVKGGVYIQNGQKFIVK